MKPCSIFFILYYHGVIRVIPLKNRTIILYVMWCKLPDLMHHILGESMSSISGLQQVVNVRVIFDLIRWSESDTSELLTYFARLWR